MFGGSETGVVLAGRREERDEEERDEEEKKLTLRLAALVKSGLENLGKVDETFLPVVRVHAAAVQ